MSSYTQLPLIVPSKRCKKCGEEKPRSEFYEHHGAKDGLRGECKACHSLKGALYRGSRKSDIAERDRRYREAHKEELSVKERLHRESHRETYAERGKRYYEANKSVILEKQRKYNEGRREHNVRRVTAWVRENKDRAKMYTERYRSRRRNAAVIDLTAQQWSACLEYFGHCCAYCGEQFDRLTMEHVVPISRGGNHTAANVIPACRSCNSRKNAKTLMEWLLVTGGE